MVAKKICKNCFCGADNSLEAFVACKLITLNKNPGLRPIHVVEVMRRIIARAVMRTFRAEKLDSAGNYQLCAGQKAGCEAAAYAMKDIFDDAGCDAVLLVADNAFNHINRKVMLHNIRLIWPIIATYVTKTYHQNARLFVMGGTEISSQEGTTQKRSRNNATLATVQPLEAVSSSDTKQAAYTDNLVSAGKIQTLRSWWERLLKIAQKVCYYPKPCKSWLIVTN